MPQEINWEDYKNFSKWEFDCSYTGKNNMRPEFLGILQQIRSSYGKPMVISSGYRDFTHPIERAKEAPGEHCFGCAVDIQVWGVEAMELLNIAYHYKINRIGINMRGAPQGRFIHLGIGDILGLGFSKGFWTY